jgi:septal ring-binding cell division protein DamX
MDLAGDRFVIELAHASRQSELAASRDAMKIPRGDLYEVRLRQNGADAWLLLWGTFDTIEAARSARSELAHGTSTTVGWPRRVAPLQAEARRASE